jgi:hypothetical protein
MKTGKDARRIKAIRCRWVFLEKKCAVCGNFFKREHMWLVDRWGVNNSRNTWYYCTSCLPTPRAVLHEIDTDDCYFGIYGIDENNTNFKKDMTKLNQRREKAFDQMNVK